MKMKTGLCAFGMTLLSFATMAKQQDVYRQFIDQSLLVNIDLIAEDIRRSLREERKYNSVIEDWITDFVYTDAFREKYADSFRKRLTEEEMQTYWSAILSKECVPTYTAEINEMVYEGKKPIPSEVKKLLVGCTKRMAEAKDILPKIDDVKALHRRYFNEVAVQYKSELYERIGQQKNIYAVVENFNKMLTIDDESVASMEMVVKPLTMEIMAKSNENHATSHFPKESITQVHTMMCQNNNGTFKEYVKMEFTLISHDEKVIGTASFNFKGCT
ncbi:hypothetical protein K6Q96_08900 [Grimontia kaedaensis]|uniref:DUF2059 domain-containing protein n=1 Tax=Grimontia kaedaensis TaxID=2872157 RepID=A0ABY4WNB6_9GAMM|nr:hypothetical protein [Grimontia kaedaensis]USH01058.1 hypothetical protein K6Q96_08900 [Grimontia kaedaensis]